MARDQDFAASDELAELVDGALAGHQAAWRALVERLHRVVWKSVNMMTTDHEIRDDAFAATWLRLAERLDTIREPEKLPGWLATTACNEVRQIVRQRGGDRLTLDAHGPDTTAGGLLETLVGDRGEHDAGVVATEERRAVRAAFGRLDETCREVLTVLVLADPPLPYDEASARLDRPIGSLGPTRGRCLEKLRRLLDADQGGST